MHDVYSRVYNVENHVKSVFYVAKPIDMNFSLAFILSENAYRWNKLFTIKVVNHSDS